MSDFYRTNPKGTWHEWSTDTTGGIIKDKPSRLFLRVDDTGDFQLEEDLVTSSSPGARMLNSEHRVTYFISVSEAKWLLRVLPEALSKLETM